MSSIFACDLGLKRRILPRKFFWCFVFHFREIFLNQPWRQMHASLILLFAKTKAFFGKDTTRKTTAFLHTLFVENERETSKLKYGGMFFSEVEGHMQKLSSFGRGKKIGLKSHLRGSSTQPFNCTLLLGELSVIQSQELEGCLALQGALIRPVPHCAARLLIPVR